MSKIIAVPMKYKPRELNKNGWMVTEEEYQKAEKDLKLSGRKLYLYNHLDSTIGITEPDSKDILGEVISREGSTYNCEIYDDKQAEFDNLIEQGFQAGMFGGGQVSAKSQTIENLVITGIGLFIED